MSPVLAPLLVLLAIAPSLSQSRINVCLYNREDFLPCRALPASGVVSPGANQYTVHATRLRRGPHGYPVCVLRKEGEIVQDIEDLGSPDVKFLFSPGAERRPNVNYVDQMLAEYNVQCEAGKQAFLTFHSLDLEPRNCYDGRQMRCQDYIEIDAGHLGIREYCGNDLPTKPLILGTGHFTLKLQTSFFNSYPGFRISVTCFKGQSRDAADVDSCTGSAGSVEQLTNSEKKTIDVLMNSLYTAALGQARLKVTSWPPASYSINEPGDILDISELSESVSGPILLELPSLQPISIPPIVLPDLIKDVEVPGIELPPVEAFQRKRRFFTQHLQVNPPLQDVHLDSKATMEAVRNEKSCNPVVHSLTSSYLTVAQRFEPVQLQAVRHEYQEELSLQNLQLQ